MSVRVSLTLGGALAAAVVLSTVVSPRAAARQAAPAAADLIVTNGYVVTMNDRREIFDRGAVVVRDARIVAVGPMETWLRPGLLPET